MAVGKHETLRSSYATCDESSETNAATELQDPTEIEQLRYMNVNLRNKRYTSRCPKIHLSENFEEFLITNSARTFAA